jgi:GNAT superfamily N-acetyltransferase
MEYRTAEIVDIPQLQIIRNAVKENTLSDPALVPDKDYEIYMTQRGKGWVCVVENTIVGFAIADLQDNNIWALFILPEYEGRGIGKQLHKIMLDWYFAKTQQTVWLSTDAGTRAEHFYKKTGWTATGKYEMQYDEWQHKK